MFTAGETVTVYRASTARDRVGDPTGPLVSHTIDNCGIVQTETALQGDSRTTAADGDRRHAVLTRMELLCPPGADIQFGDRVQLPGDTTMYEVDGMPWSPRNPFTTWQPGIRVRLRGVA